MADERVVCAGYTVVDVVVDAGIPRDFRTGGTAANVAANLAWLGAPQVDLAARVGADPAGRLIRSHLHAGGVDVQFVDLDPNVQTPVLIHEVTGSPTEPRYLFTCPTCRRSSAAFRPITVQQAQAVASPAPSVFFFDRASAAALIIAKQVRDTGGIVMFEPNSVGREQLTSRAIELASIVKISGGRGDGLRALLDSSPRAQVQIWTDGAKGLAWRRFSEKWHHEPAHTSLAVDTSGAGDWLTGGLLHSLTRSELTSDSALREALARGQALAAVSCEHLGARGLATAPRERIIDQLTRRGLNVVGHQRSGAAVAAHPGEDISCTVCLAPETASLKASTARLATIGR